MEEKELDKAISQADANQSLEGLTLTSQEKDQIKKEVLDQKSYLLSLYEEFEQRKASDESTRQK